MNVQRIEKGQNAGLESLKSLAAVFEVNVEHLQKEPEMNSDSLLTLEEKQVLAQVQEIKSFYQNLLSYVCVIAMLFAINLWTDPSYIWAWWPAMGWGIGIVIHGINAFKVFNLFSPEWERKQVEKRLGRKL